MEEESMFYSTGASSVTGGQQIAKQLHTQPGDMLTRSTSRCQERTTESRAAFGGHAVVSVNASGNATQGVELLPALGLPMRTGSDAHAEGYHASLDNYARVTEYAQRKIRLRAKTRETMSCTVCGRMTLSVEMMQQRAMDEKLPDEPVKRKAERGPRTVRKPVIEETEQRMAVKQAIHTINHDRSTRTRVTGSSVVLNDKSNAFRRASKSDPPVRT